MVATSVMKAQVLRGPDRMELETLQVPRPGPGEVLVRVTHCGICGSDVKYYHGSVPLQYPRILGHEIVGVVEADESGRLRPGTRVVVDPMVYCGACAECQDGLTHLCANGRLAGMSADGGFGEYMAVPTGNVYPLPDHVPNSVAVTVQPLTTCVHSQRLVSFFPGDTMVVLGMGVTGLLHAQLARLRGARLVIGVDVATWKRDLVREMGVDEFLETGSELERVRELTGGRGADVVIDAVGSVPTFARSIELVRPGGQVLVFGTIPATSGELPFYQMYYKEVRVLFSRAHRPDDFRTALRLIERRQVELEPLVTHVLPLARAREALALLEDPQAPRLKVVLEHSV